MVEELLREVYEGRRRSIHVSVSSTCSGIFSHLGYWKAEGERCSVKGLGGLGG